MRVNNDSTLLGRTLDLTAAYKQLSVNLMQGRVRVMVAYDPVRSKPAFFVFKALPFRATGSVYSFNRVAKSLGGPLGVLRPLIAIFSRCSPPGLKRPFAVLTGLLLQFAIRFVSPLSLVACFSPTNNPASAE